MRMRTAIAAVPAVAIIMTMTIMARVREAGEVEITVRQVVVHAEDLVL